MAEGGITLNLGLNQELWQLKHSDCAMVLNV